MEVGDSILEEVADSAWALGEEVECVVCLDVLREYEHPDVPVRGADALGRLEALS